jgi:ATP-dependent DNA helicase RecG
VKSFGKVLESLPRIASGRQRCRARGAPKVSSKSGAPIVTTGTAATEREFDCATATGKTRLIFVKGSGDKARHPKMQALIRKAGAQLIRRRFTGIADLTTALFASLVEYLEHSGVLQNRLFEDRPAHDATLDHIDLEAVTAFVRRARSARQFPLPESAPVTDVLAHLGLLHGRQPTNASLLLFGRQPQHFVPAAEVRCMHFHGTEFRRPAPSYQIFKGRLFDQLDRAADFVLGVLNRTVGTRALSSQAPVAYEIPPDVIREAIVNAVVHRDYTSGAAGRFRFLPTGLRFGIPACSPHRSHPRVFGIPTDPSPAIRELPRPFSSPVISRNMAQAR